MLKEIEDLIRETLTDDWKMKEVGSQECFNVSVPASVLSVLLENGQIEDPFYRDNEKKYQYLFEKDYEFTRTFSVTGDYIREDELDLVFYGLDTVTDIYLNNEKLLSTQNMHRTYRVPIKNKARAGSNELRIVFHSPLRFISEYKPEPGKEIVTITTGCTKGNQYLRKSHSMFGWDWGPVLPDSGIFRKIELEAYSRARIEEVIFDQKHDESGEVRLSVDTILKVTDTIPVEIVVSVSGQQEVSKTIRMLSEGTTETKRGDNELVVNIRDPKLWWPNGLGEQYLYDVKVTIKKSDMVFDEREYKIGLRTLTVSREKDEYGEEFAFMINGLKIFAFGANYIPEDCLYTRITRERIESLVKDAARANYNCLRVWGGGYYPSDDFYDLCDKYGLIVWQDLMFACNVYDMTPEFQSEIEAEIVDNVKRFRHHACIGLVSGNNEMEAAWLSWESFLKESPYLKADYIKMFEHVVPTALRSVDETVFYWPSSPCSVGCFDDPEDENRGDAHYWEVWHGQKPFTEYSKHYFRFLSEFGFQSFPCMKTVSTFTEPQDRNIFSYVMEQHQKNGWANGKILYYVSENFQYPIDFESLLYVSQILQGMAIKSGVQHMRRHRGRCMGSLYWQMNDNWPVASWSSIDYYGRWKPLHYMAREFYKPTAGSLVRTVKDGQETNAFTAYVVNDAREDVSFKVKQTLYDMNGKELVHFEDSGRAFFGKVVTLKEHDYDRYVKHNGEQNVYLEAEFTYGDGSVQTEVATFVPYKHMNLKAPLVTFSVTELDDMYEITLTSNVFTPFVYLDLYEKDGIFEKNVFSLTGNKPVVTYLNKADIVGEPFKDTDDFCDHLDIWYLQKSYMTYSEEEITE